MGKYIRGFTIILGVLGVLSGIAGCSVFDQNAAEQAINDIIGNETERLYAEPLSFDLAIDKADSIKMDTLALVTAFSFSTTTEWDSVEIYFNQKRKGDSLITIGDTANVVIKHGYTGTLSISYEYLDDGNPFNSDKSFTTERTIYASLADNEGWTLTGYSFADERTDTNTTQIFSIEISGVEDAISSPSLVYDNDSFPELSQGEVTILLRTAADTSSLVCFAKGSETVRFQPKQNIEENWDNRWEATVSVGPNPLIVGIINRETLTSNGYPADADIWIIPIGQ